MIRVEQANFPVSCHQIAKGTTVEGMAWQAIPSTVDPLRCSYRLFTSGRRGFFLVDG